MIKVSRRNELCLVMTCFMYLNLNLCSSLNDEGLALFRARDGASSNWKDDFGVIDLCSWFGVRCSDKSFVAMNIVKIGASAHRKLLQAVVADPWTHPKNQVTPLLPVGEPLISPSPSPFLSPSPAPTIVAIPDLALPVPSAPASLPSIMESPSKSAKGSSTKNHLVLILSTTVGGCVLLVILLIGLLRYRGNKMASVRPWATRSIGQLQKAIVTGVPRINRSELEIACEDFSNVVGSSAIGTVYKGTLSSGVEIAVTSVPSHFHVKNWSKHLEAQFRDKIDTLSKLNHKNFMNLLGYCEEEEPFTRMLIFEYAPNGTLFEHLHVMEAEHLDWTMRMRVAMGIAYCLDHMNQSTPPIAHKNLNSLAIYLTEDYAAKISDFGIWNDIAVSGMELYPESNIYSFGVILFEMITGRLLYSVDSGSFEDRASDFLRGENPLRELVDPTLKFFQAEQLEEIGDLIKYCVQTDPRQRPSMREVTERLREITAIGPDEAIPKPCPLWWAELEILST